jgi:hypothetical protein
VDVIGLVDFALMDATVRAEYARRSEGRAAIDAYRGLFTNPLEVLPGEANDNVKVNIIKSLVLSGRDFLFAQPPDFELPDETDGEDGYARSAKEKWIAEWLRVNAWGAYLLDQGTNGATCGTPYYKFTGEMLDNPDDPAHPFPRFHSLDPLDMTIMADRRDIDKVMSYVWQYNAGPDPKTKKPRVERQVVERVVDGMSGANVWRITDQHSASGMFGLGGGWVTDSVEIWPFPWAPIDHCKNLPCPNEVYGEPDVTETLISDNDAINFNLSNRRRIDRFHSHPIIFLIGYNGQMTKINAGIGKVVSLPANVTVQQEAPRVDGSASSQFKREIYEHMLEESGTPSIILGRSDDMANNPSGVALRTKMYPIIARTETKRKLYGPWIVEMIRRGMELSGFGPRNIVTLKWKLHIPNPILEEAQALQIYSQSLNVSPQTLLTMVDLDPDIESDNLKEWEAAHPQPVAVGAGANAAGGTSKPAGSAGTITNQMATG